MYYAMKKIFSIRVEQDDLDWLISYAREINQQPTTLVSNWIHAIRVYGPHVIELKNQWGTQQNPALWAK